MASAGIDGGVGSCWAGGEGFHNTNTQTPAIHAVVEGDTPTGQVKAGRQGRQDQDVAEEADGVVIGHGRRGEVERALASARERAGR